MCRSVLFPAPETPRMASESPRTMSRLTPFRASIREPSIMYVLLRFRISIRPAATLLIPDCLRGIKLRCIPGRVDRRQQADDEAARDDDRHVFVVDERRQLAQVVDVPGQDLEPEEILDGPGDGPYVPGNREPCDGSQQRPDAPDDDPLEHEYFHDALRRGAHGLEDGDVFRLFHDDHDERADYVEARHEHDQAH